MTLCRTLLFMPGNNPGMLSSAGALGADVVIFDLEDAVARTEKDAARILVRNALTYAKPEGMDVVVRINALDTPFWLADMTAVAAAGADHVLLPKCNGPEDVIAAVETLDVLERESASHGHGGARSPVGLLAIIETALGMENACAIASSHPRLAGLLLGAEDLTLELGAKRTPKGDEVLYARSRLLMACRAAGIRAFDCPFPFVTDLEGMAADAAFAAQLGFDGKAVISPHHVHAVNEAFTPAGEQIRWAERVMAAARRAEKEGKGAVSLDGMMIDLPVIKRAEKILSRVEGRREPDHA